MKKLIFGCAIAVGGLVLPQAFADFGYSNQCAPCCDVRGFDGFYVGGNLGVASNFYGRNDLDNFFSSGMGFSAKGVTDRATNVTVGVLAGYDWQCSNYLLGVVGDWNWTNIRRTLTLAPNEPADDFFYRNRSKWFSTIRARAGVVFCDALIYLTGGGAVIRADNTYHAFDATGGDEFRSNHTRWGWVGGVGTEFMLGCNWSIGAELLLCQFDGYTRTFTDPTVPERFSFNNNDSLVVGRITLNYRFGDLCGCFF